MEKDREVTGLPDWGFLTVLARISDGRESIQVAAARVPVEARGNDERAETEIEQVGDGFLGVAETLISDSSNDVARRRARIRTFAARHSRTAQASRRTHARHQVLRVKRRRPFVLIHGNRRRSGPDQTCQGTFGMFPPFSWSASSASPVLHSQQRSQHEG